MSSSIPAYPQTHDRRYCASKTSLGAPAWPRLAQRQWTTSARARTSSAPSWPQTRFPRDQPQPVCVERLPVGSHSAVSGDPRPRAAAPVHVRRRRSRSVVRASSMSRGGGLLAARSDRGTFRRSKVLCDDDALDLVGALIDLRDLCVTHHPLHGEVVGVIVTAEDLNSVDGHAHRGI